MASSSKQQENLKFHDATKRHIINLQWYGPPIVQQQGADPSAAPQQQQLSSLLPASSNNVNNNNNYNPHNGSIVMVAGDGGNSQPDVAASSSQSAVPNIDIVVSSRKLKGTEVSPNDILFRTHQYEIRLLPNQAFFDWGGGRRSGYIVDLKLFIKRSATASNSKNKNDSFADGKYHEYFVCDLPVITYTYLEDVFTNSWILNLQWPDERRCSFRGDFCFSLQVFRRVDDTCYKRVFFRTSSSFRIVSKPGVFLNKKPKRQREKEMQDEDKKNAPKSKKAKGKAAANDDNNAEEGVDDDEETVPQTLIPKQEPVDEEADAGTTKKAKTKKATQPKKTKQGKKKKADDDEEMADEEKPERKKRAPAKSKATSNNKFYDEDEEDAQQELQQPAEMNIVDEAGNALQQFTDLQQQILQHVQQVQQHAQYNPYVMLMNPAMAQQFLQQQLQQGEAAANTYASTNTNEEKPVAPEEPTTATTKPASPIPLSQQSIGQQTKPISSQQQDNGVMYNIPSSLDFPNSFINQEGSAAAEQHLTRSPAPLSSILSPMSPFATPKGILSISFSQPLSALGFTNSLNSSQVNNAAHGNDSQDKNSQKFDSLFTAATAASTALPVQYSSSATADGNVSDDEASFYQRHFEK